jgi:NADH dehydrogenase FAD-containing subunit
VPNSELLKTFSPASIAPSGAILVESTLQVKDAPSSNIFAVGDVIDLPGPKQGRPASLQGFLVAGNIVRAIRGKPMKHYAPSILDHSIELTLGLVSQTSSF